ncbi:MAG: hypothetical protein HDS88_04215 [Bacteroidales bacterium]|nr:hypothetical protein [Bacteroidales bacterium]
MEQPYKANTLIVKSVGMLPGASAEYTSLSMNVQHIQEYRPTFTRKPVQEHLIVKITFWQSFLP